MHTPSPSCRRSSPSRLEWRPSRLQAGAQALVLLAAPWLLGASALPEDRYWPALLAVWVLGVIQSVVRLRRPRRWLDLTVLPAPLQLDGSDIDAPRLVVRGPWLLLHWRREGRQGRLLFWPDVLNHRQRRELRLAVSARDVSRRPRTMAP
ncbi:hypothetical protein [Stenotrophomonas sp. NPDC077659]|uniref:hypothetical protein n=1 Tax=Stenotrophomonas sp. NPDC077659 TaxID=3390694 RepID=UPI003D02E985